MAVKKSEDQFRVLLVETILAMCRNTLNYDSEVSVEGLIGITLDKEEIFLVTINQLISNPDAVSSTGKRKRKRKRKSKQSQESNSDDSDNQSGTEDESRKRSRQQSGQSDHSSRKDKDDKEHSKSAKSGRDRKNGDDDLVFLKEEPGANSSGQDASQSSYSFPNVSEALSSGSQSAGQSAGHSRTMHHSVDMGQQQQHQQHQQHQQQRDGQYMSSPMSRQDHPIAGTSQGFTSPSKQSAVPLWEFLLDLLNNPQFSNVISWTGNGWEFRISQPGELARMWGDYKGFPKMSYDSLSRSLRQYYQRDIIQKTKGKMYVYHFTESIAAKKINMIQEEKLMLGAFNPFTPFNLKLKQSSLNEFNLHWNPTEGATGVQPQDGATCNMTSQRTEFKRRSRKSVAKKLKPQLEDNDSLLDDVDFSDMIYYPSSDLRYIKKEVTSNSDASSDIF